MLDTIKVKLKLTKPQEEFCLFNGGACRFLYNEALRQNINSYNSTKTLKLSNTNDILYNLLKNQEFSWLKQCEQTSLTQSLHNLESAFKNFFHSRNKFRKGKIISFPRFKSKHKSRYNFTIINENDFCKLRGSNLSLPKLGLVNVWNFQSQLKDRLNDEKIKRVTISRDSDQGWYASILIDRKNLLKPIYKSTNLTVGIDVGIRTSIACYDNVGDYNSVQSPDITKLDTKIKTLHKVLSRKQRGSKNESEARTKLAKTYFHAKNIRKYFNHKMSDFLVKTYDVITVENLSIQHMMKQHLLAGKIQNQAWYQFISFLDYKCMRNEKTLIKVDTYFPSSKLCSNCKSKNDIGGLEWYCCPTCGYTHNRDENAAKNLNKISEHFKNTNQQITTEKEFLLL
jgi:putative transposase